VNLPSVDFVEEGKILSERMGLPMENTYESNKDASDYLHHNDVISHALYPEVHQDFR
jgi:hypothetical protein